MAVLCKDFNSVFEVGPSQRFFLETDDQFTPRNQNLVHDGSGASKKTTE